jgi:hypothetical protein
VAALHAEEKRGGRARLATQARGVAHQHRGAPHADLAQRQRVLVHVVERSDFHRLAGRRDALGDAIGSLAIGADDEDRGDVGIAAEADQLALVHAACPRRTGRGHRGRDQQRAAHVARDASRRPGNQAENRKHEDMVARADAPIGPAIAEKAAGWRHRHSLPCRRRRRLPASPRAASLLADLARC